MKTNYSVSGVTAVRNRRVYGRQSLFVQLLKQELLAEQLQAAEHCYRLLLLKAGHIEYTCGEERVLVNRHYIGVIKPGDSISAVVAEEISGFIISFSYDYLELNITLTSVAVRNFHTHTLDVYRMPVQAGALLHMQNLVWRLYRELNGPELPANGIIQSLFSVFVLWLCRITAGMAVVAGRHNEYIRKFYSLLDMHFVSMQSTADYARLLSLTPNYLNALTRSKLGCTPSFLIQQRVLAEAKRLLMYQDLNMKEVAFRLGFVDVSHFSRFFKRMCGETFSEFRKSFS